MIWHVRFSTFAEKDWKSFDRYHQKVIDKAIQKVMQNPTADGYGKPLANLSGSHLHGLYKIKLKKSGIRIVYALIEVEGEMLIIIIGARANDEVYDLAAKRYARMKQRRQAWRAASFCYATFRSKGISFRNFLTQKAPTYAIL